MKNFSVLSQIAFGLVAWHLGSAVSFAEYSGESYNPEVASKNLDRAERVLNPVNEGLKGAVTDGKDASKDLSKTIQENLKKVEEKFTTDKKILDWREKNRKITKEIDQLKKLNNFPAILEFAAQKRQEDKNKAIKDQLAKQSAPTAPGTADFDISDADSKCSKGVDFGGAKVLPEATLKYFKQEVSALIEEGTKKDAEDKLKALERLEKEFTEASLEEEEDEAEKKKKSVLSQNNTPAKQLEELKATNGKLKEVKKEKSQALPKALFGMVKSLLKKEGNDKRAGEIAGNVSGSFELFRKSAYDAAIAGGKQLRGNCVDLKDKLGENAGSGVLKQVYDKIVEYHNGDPTQYANPGWVPIAQEVGSSAVCSNPTAKIEAALGSSLAAENKAFASITDGKTMIESAFDLYNKHIQARSKLGPVIQGLKNQCNSIANNFKKATQKLAGLNKQVEAAANEGAAPAGGASSAKAPGQKSSSQQASAGQWRGGRSGGGSSHNAR